MIWEYLTLFWEYLKNTAWFWQILVTVLIPLYFMHRDRKLKRDQLKHISEVISDFIKQYKKKDSGEIYKDHELLKNKSPEEREAMAKHSNFRLFLDRLSDILRNRAFNIDYKISFVLEDFLRNARFTFDTYTNELKYQSIDSNNPPENINQVELPNPLPIHFYKPYIEILERIQSEYLSEKTLWEKMKKLLEKLK